jgi:hypothetical protein
MLRSCVDLAAPAHDGREVEDVAEIGDVQSKLLVEVPGILVQFAEHVAQVGMQEQHASVAVDGDAAVHPVALPGRPGVRVRAHAEVVDDQDAVGRGVEQPLDHVAAHESAAARYQVCCHAGAKMRLAMPSDRTRPADDERRAVS